jgi:acyl-CoA reductase-like NAD-dependent aldehyde dehydrogenase
MSDTLLVLEPATEAVLEEIPAASAADVDAAVARARASLPAWRSLAPGARAERLRALADALAAEQATLAQLEARNAGKPISDARDEIDMVVETFRYYAALPERLFGETIPVEGGQAWTVREALGVVGLIVPWNFPLCIAAWKLAPALAAGNTVVLKPAELTPLSAKAFEQIAAPILGPGVVNVVAGLGPVAGARLVEHPDVAKIAFTGSTRVGRLIAASAAATVKRVTLELGGKSANMIFADADLEAAAAAAPMAVFANAGQDCCARSRILVQRSALDRFMSLLEPHVRAVSVGDPLAESTQVGPLISAAQRARVETFVDTDVEVAFSADAPSGAGFWFPPTVVALANATIYGLSGSIWTENGARALRVARAVDAGVLSINSNRSVRVSTPFGGFKQSGYGRELGPHATDAYTEVKSIFFATPPA